MEKDEPSRLIQKIGVALERQGLQPNVGELSCKLEFSLSRPPVSRAQGQKKNTAPRKEKRSR